MAEQLVSPVLELRSTGAEHETAGLAGYPAHDWFAPAGAVVVSPVDGVCFKTSGHDPRGGPVPGAAGVYGWSVYLQADDGSKWYMTHLATRSVKVGQRVRRGQALGTVANWHRYGRPDHVHMGVHAAPLA